MAIAEAPGIILGYNKCKNNSLLLEAPWDMGSNSANFSFATLMAKWNYNNVGIEYRTPNKMPDATRCEHNEVATQRWYWNKELNEIEQDKPDFVIYVKTKTDMDMESDRKYKMCVKAAAQLDIPLRIIDVEKNFKREQNRIEKYMRIFAGKEKNKTGMTEEEILERIIVDIENNRVAIGLAEEKLKKRYFTNEMRDEIYLKINEVIDGYKAVDGEKYKKLVFKFQKLMTEERLKGVTSAGMIIERFDKNSNFFIQQKAKRMDTCNFRDFCPKYGTITQINRMIKEITEKDFYKGSKEDTIKHIQRIILFSGLLSELNGIDEDSKISLLSAAAFLGCGKTENIKENKTNLQKIEEFYNANHVNQFGINRRNLGIIMTAMKYCEYDEKDTGVLDKDEIRRIAVAHSVKKQNLEKTEKICELLKDAYTLANVMFGDVTTIDSEVLKSEISRLQGVTNFAFNLGKKIEECEKSPLTSDDLFRLVGLERANKDLEHIKSREKQLVNVYRKFEITIEDLEKVQEMIRERVDTERDNNIGGEIGE